MIGQFLIFLAIPFHDLLLTAFETTMYVFALPIFVEDAVDDKKISSVFNVLRCNRIEIAPGMRQVINGIQDIGLSYPVVSDQAIDFLVELKVFLIEI